jgi:hypothetical protein
MDAGKMRRQGKINGTHARQFACLVVAFATFFLVLVIQLTRAEEGFRPTGFEQPAVDQGEPQRKIVIVPWTGADAVQTTAASEDTSAKDQAGQKQSGAAPAASEGAAAKDQAGQKPGAPDSATKGSTQQSGAAAGQTFDPALVSRGQAAFEQSCTTCHDAARALERTKDLAGWRATVRRMAAKQGAEVAAGDMEAIATYLASRSAPASGNQAGGGAAASTGASADASSVSAFATLSPMWRVGNNHLENPGFGPLAFFGASWQSNVVSARVTLCITCHGVQEPGVLSRVDPLEVAVHFDFSQCLDSHVKGMKGGLDAGRFVIPFGAFSAQVNPGLYHTVSPPLIFNMGERIYNADLGFPVLPMPDADEGVDLNLTIPLGCCCGKPLNATIDTYAVNGLEGNASGIDFLQSRDLLDNNNKAAGGGRLTIGTSDVRFGASVTAGRFDDPKTSGFPEALDYLIYGCDVQAKYERLFRFQAEFARRGSDRIAFNGFGFGVVAEAVQGYYLEAEARPYDDCHVSFLVRYDSQSRRNQLPPPGSTLPSGKFDVERLTLGINFELWRQSLLMLDYEHWLLPEPNQPTADIAGVRYTITF